MVGPGEGKPVDLGDAEPGAAKPTFVGVGERVLDTARARKAAEARAKLRAYGIVPPDGRCAAGAPQPLRFVRKTLSCPRCGSNDTEKLSEFGSTACKSTWRCKAITR